MKKDNELDKIFEKIEKTNLQELMNQSMYNPDADKRKVYETLYTYALDKKQENLLKNDKFII